MGLTVITGGGGDFGRAMGIQFGAKGSVLLTNRSTAKLADSLEIMQSLGIECRSEQLDVSDRESCFRCAEKAKAYAEELGTDITAVINIAGISGNYFSGLKSVDHIKINALGTVHITDAFYDVLAPGATVIHFASMAAHNLPMFSDGFVNVYTGFAEGGFVDKMMGLVRTVKPTLQEDYTSYDEAQEKEAYGMAYCLSKNFVIWYVQANIKKFAKKNMRIMSISPGTHLTRHIREMSEETVNRQMALNPLNRWGKPIDMASSCVYFCSEAAGYFTGCDILIDGGAQHGRVIKQLD